MPESFTDVGVCGDAKRLLSAQALAQVGGTPQRPRYGHVAQADVGQGAERGRLGAYQIWQLLFAHGLVGAAYLGFFTISRRGSEFTWPRGGRW
ncbi:hypothetical protein [Phytohabitans houttuyneae]|uniref:Uncharacterized protein n=1 Tax=Phytohabitans houttuyneae TaxID=1076126 RepID=A0A6V8KGE2_9ACTN|nr:hypothetical protein [Phytohabitans houttuyneae]GFJ81159.1 hypothetical protein Phou_053390 [Phytohabitans houttuyneae]